MPYFIVPIVEGHGEVEAVPTLIRRVLREHLNEYELQIAGPKRLRRNKIEADLPKMLKYAVLDPKCKAIIILVDSDKDCALELASNISRVTARQNIGMPVAIVCPKTEYETWFIASIDTIKGCTIGQREVVIDPAAICPGNVETVSGAKEWLNRWMPKNMIYKATQDQKPLTKMIDLQLAIKHSRSFRRLCHAVEEVVDSIQTGSVRVTPSVIP